MIAIKLHPRYRAVQRLSKTIFNRLVRFAMSARCQITGRTVGFGKAVSHSHRRTRRRWPPNIQLKAYYLPSEDRRIKVRVSAQGIKVIDRDGHRGRRRAARAGSAPAHFARQAGSSLRTAAIL